MLTPVQPTSASEDRHALHWTGNDGRWAGLSVVLLGVIFLVDILTPLGLVDGMAYLLALLAAGFAASSRWLWTIAGLASGLTILGGFLSPPGAPLAVGGTNRLLSLAAIWLTAWVIWQWRQAARRQVFDSSERLQSILKHSDAIIFMKDLQGRYLEVSDGYSALLVSGPVVGRTDHELFPPEVAAIFREGDLKTIEAGHSMYFEELAPYPQGLRAYAVCKFPLRNAEGQIVGVGGVATDVTARLEAEAAQRDAQERLDLVVRATQTGIWDWDIRTNQVYYSPLWKQSLGYAEDELSASPAEWESRLHPDDKDRAFALVDDFLSGRIAEYELEHRLRHRDGTYRWIHTLAVLQRDANGKPTRMIGSHVDITQRKQAEDALRDSQAVLRAFFESDVLMMGVVELLEDDILHLSDNGRTAAFFGTTSEAMAGKRASELGAPPAAIARWVCHYRECERTGAPVRFECTHRRVPDAPEDLYSVVVSWIGRSPHGRSRFSYVMDDVTAERRTAAALLESAEQYRAVVAALAEGIVMQDTAGQILACNPSAEQILGLTADLMMGRTSMDSRWQAVREDGTPLPGDEHPAAVSLRTGQPYTNVVMGVHHPSRGLRWISINSQPLIRTPADRPHAVVVSFYDITERRLAEQALVEARSHLEARVRERTARIHQLESERSRVEKLAALGQLAADVAHEINNPLAGIKNAFHLVKQGIDDQHRYHRFVGLIDREIERLATIVRKMYALYQGAPASPRKKTSVAEVINDVVMLLDHKLSAKQLRLATSLHLASDAVMISRTDLFQTLLNLVQNAIDASPPGEEIAVTVEERQGWMRWSVVDHGPGIQPGVLPRIFDPFFSTKAAEGRPGLGLGLSVSLALARAMGGRIEVATEVGRGSTFTLVHPRGDQEVPPEPMASAPPLTHTKEHADDDYAGTHIDRRR